jgi:hypothetical protein
MEIGPEMVADRQNEKATLAELSLAQSFARAHRDLLLARSRLANTLALLDRIQHRLHTQSMIEARTLANRPPRPPRS